MGHIEAQLARLGWFWWLKSIFQVLRFVYFFYVQKQFWHLIRRKFEFKYFIETNFRLPNFNSAIGVVIRHIIRRFNPLKLRINQLFLIQVLLLERLLLHRLHEFVNVFILVGCIQ